MTESNQTKLNARDLAISPKMSMEICRRIRNRDLKYAQNLMEDVIKMKRPLRVTRFNRDLGHKKGNGPGRYPINAAKEFLNLLKSVKKNAENKGLNADNLIISFAKADKGGGRYRYGRKGKRRMKNTLVSLTVTEKEPNNIKEKK